MSPTIDKNDLVYTPYYCEENAWKFCEKIKNELDGNQIDNYYTIFISNQLEMVPLWKQKVGEKYNDNVVTWDYHVINIHRTDENCMVYDFDCILPFPSEFDHYSNEVFRQYAVNEKYHYLFRVINAQEYLNHFASDRSRMRNKDGNYIKPPPDYPPIKTSKSTNNLNDFIQMDPNKYYVGKVMNLQQLRDKFSMKN